MDHNMLHRQCTVSVLLRIMRWRKNKVLSTHANHDYAWLQHPICQITTLLVLVTHVFIVSDKQAKWGFRDMYNGTADSLEEEHRQIKLLIEGDLWWTRFMQSQMEETNATSVFLIGYLKVDNCILHMYSIKKNPLQVLHLCISHGWRQTGQCFIHDVERLN